ncbi:MAG: hypothetical protein GYB19_10085 [Rhodospirillales bacterium]|nr:hypothetical protein [Rhodospirillales bacterium]
MIEKMARAMASNRGFDPDKMIRKPVHHGYEFSYEDVPVWWSYRKDAEAALSALEKPTGDMLLYGHDVVGFGMPNCKRAFCAMIAAAKEGK